MWGIWCKERKNNKGDWFRCGECAAILAFESKADACKRAAQEYGFDTYTEAKARDWCEVRKLNG